MIMRAKHSWGGDMMDRWPRTFLLGILLLCVAVTIALMVCAVYLLGIYGPCYLGAAGFVWVAVAAIRGDVQDRKKP